MNSAHGRYDGIIMGWNIFIYGTLKKGEPNHWLIKKLRNHARFLSQAQTKEKLPLGIGLEQFHFRRFKFSMK